MNLAYALNPNWHTSNTDVCLPLHRTLPGRASGTERYKPIADDEFTEYELYSFAGWDGYEATPISTETLRAARRFKQLLPRGVPIADIAPGADGSIGFEWRTGPASARTVTFVEVGPGDRVKAIRVYSNGSEPDVWPARPFYQRIRDFIDVIFAPDELN